MITNGDDLKRPYGYIIYSDGPDSLIGAFTGARFICSKYAKWRVSASKVGEKSENLKKITVESFLQNMSGANFNHDSRINKSRFG
jgi:hypothetical protein